MVFFFNTYPPDYCRLQKDHLHRSPSRPLPPGITRRFIDTPLGNLELHEAYPRSITTDVALLFVHGGFGSADCYTNYLPFFASHGYIVYAISLRGHGESWNPGYKEMYSTGLDKMVEDLRTAILYIQNKLHRQKLVLAGHSSGAGCVQSLLGGSGAEKLEGIKGAVLLGPVPGYGSAGVNINWSLFLDPWLLPRFIFRDGLHPRSPLSSTGLVRQAFFCNDCEDDIVRTCEQNMSKTESMSWPADMAKGAFTDPKRLVNALEGLGNGKRRIFVVGAGDDKLVGNGMKLVEWLRGGLDGQDGDPEELVMAGLVEGAGHHLMMDCKWRKGAEILLEWLEAGDNTGGGSGP